MKASTLVDWVIVLIAISAIIILISYMGLNYTPNKVPSDMPSLGVTLAGGALAAGILKSKSRFDDSVKGSIVNYSLLGLAFTQFILVVHYNSLIWFQITIPEKLAPSIHGLVIILQTVTNFSNLGSQESDTLRSLENLSIHKEIETDKT